MNKNIFQNALISAMNLTYKIKNKWKNKLILSNIDFAINEGESVCIIGKNGAGKTTLIELLFGFREDYTGKIKYSDSLTSHKIGFVLQDMYFVTSDVQALLKFHLKIFKKDKCDLDAILKKIDFLEIYHERKISYLSEGQKQKLKLVLALLAEPTFLVLDEITTSLDYTSKKNIIDYLIRFKNEKKRTVILISHNIKEISLLADYLYIIDNRRISEKIPLPLDAVEKNKLLDDIFKEKLFYDKKSNDKTEIKQFY